MEYIKLFLNSIIDLAKFLVGNWAEISACIAFAYWVYTRIRLFMEKSREEKITIAKDQIDKFMLQYVSDAEKDYSDWYKAGETKRAQVIARIYHDYPVLASVADQDALIDWIDTVIKTSLKKMREMVKDTSSAE